MKKKFKKNNLLVFLHFFLWSLYFTYFWLNSLFLDERGNLIAGQINIWGDWAAHFTMGSALAYRSNVFQSGPLLINSSFSYPFFANLLSAILIRLKLPFFVSFVLPSFIFSIILIFALFFFYQKILVNNKKAILASNLFLLNGGIGFYYFLKDLANSEHPLGFILNLETQYTRIDRLGIKFINVIDSMIIPQRAFNHGFPLALIGLALIYPLFFQITKPNKKRLFRLIGAGLLVGLLPIIHTHSFLVTVILLAFWSLYLILIPIGLPTNSWYKKLLSINQLSIKAETKKIWDHFYPVIIVAGTSILIALPILFKFFFPHVGNSFFKYFPGWLAPEYDLNWLVFWWRNWTVAPLSALIALFMILKNKQNRLKNFLTFSPFFLLFILANLVLFQPFAWDNTKIIIWSSLGFSALNAWLIFYLWDQSNILRANEVSREVKILDSFSFARIIKKNKTNIQRIIISWQKLSLQLSVIFLAFLLLASGFIDAYYQLQIKKHSYAMYTAEELELADWVKNNTDPSSIWLTGDKHNHWLFNLTGRQAIMTYPGWLWTHGYDYAQTQADVYNMYRQPENSSQLFEKYDVDYIVLGQQEINDLKANEDSLTKKFNLIYTTQNYKLYQRGYGKTTN